MAGVMTSLAWASACSLHSREVGTQPQHTARLTLHLFLLPAGAAGANARALRGTLALWVACNSSSDGLRYLIKGARAPKSCNRINRGLIIKRSKRLALTDHVHTGSRPRPHSGAVPGEGACVRSCCPCRRAGLYCTHGHLSQTCLLSLMQWWR